MAALIDAVVGHREHWQNLLHQMRQGSLPHAIAFVGMAGIGKKRVAWALAQALLCERAEAPCGQCAACQRVANQQSESVLFVEPEGPQIKLEATQKILSFMPLRRLGKARVVIIDEAQLMNPQAGNALLKVVEEPPEQTYFILIVSELAQVLPTLRSRTQVLRFAPLSEAQLRTLTSSSPTEWMVRSARGSLAQLENFAEAEFGELRGLAFGLVTSALKRQRSGLNEFLDQTKDRALSLRAARLLQQILRDWSLLEIGGLIHADLIDALEALPKLPGEQRVDLWRSAFAIEQDLMAHVDRQLLFENFYYRVQQVAGL